MKNRNSILIVLGLGCALYGNEGDLIHLTNVLPCDPALCALIVAGTWRNDATRIQEMARLGLLEGDELRAGVRGVALSVLELRAQKK